MHIIDYIWKLIEKWGTQASGITAFVQLPIWIIGLPYLYFKERKWKKKHDIAQSDRNYWKEECYRMKDIASEWHNMTKEVVKIMKRNIPDIHKEFVGEYGGEYKFQDWYKLPDMPSIQESRGQDE